jgi:antitoxin component YwqK of YwqJK toxin-antitoxin module
MSDELTLEEKIVQQLRKNQDLGYAIIGGISAALIGAALWAIITVSTGYQIGYMAIGVGFLVGFAVRFFGAGVDLQYRIIGAACALLGCMLGNLFSQVWFMAEAESLGYFETLGYLDFSLIQTIYQETFSFMDLLFYGIAVYEGYRFAVREVTDEMIEQYNATQTVPPQANSKLRLPIVIVCFLSIGILWYFVSSQSSGPRTYYYESGEKMSEGELVNNKEEGLWSYWHLSGPLQASGNYKDGIQTGEWQWYNEEGNVVKKGSYKNGMEEGLWLVYHPTGIVSDSGSFSQGRENGEWISKAENGTIIFRGRYERSKLEGECFSFYADGTPSSKGLFAKGIRTGRWQFWHENGKLSQEVDCITENEVKIINAWDSTGKQMVSNGTGTFYTFYPSGKIKSVSQVKEGKQTGSWTSYYEDGKKRDAGEYKNDLLYVFNMWSPEGKEELTNGIGTYTIYYDDNKTVMETGEVKNGLRDGLWSKFYENGTDTLETATYVHGEMTGLYRVYFPDNLIQAQGAFLEDKREGEWIWYFESGNVESTVYYVSDKKEGDQIFYNGSGVELKTEVYSENELLEVKLLLQEEEE